MMRVAGMVDFQFIFLQIQSFPEFSVRHTHTFTFICVCMYVSCMCIHIDIYMLYVYSENDKEERYKRPTVRTR